MSDPHGFSAERWYSLAGDFWSYLSGYLYKTGEDDTHALMALQYLNDYERMTGLTETTWVEVPVREDMDASESTS